MKKHLLLTSFLFPFMCFAQNPASFSWGKYVSPVNDQLRQNPCFTFATVGGVETAHRLYYGLGYAIDLSERQVYSCAGSSGGVASISSALQYINANGVTTSFCVPYATGTCTQDSDNGPYSIVIRPCTELQTQLDNCTDKRRVKAAYHEVTNTMKLGNEDIKSVLIGNGPIMLSLTTPALHQGATHAYLLYGYSTSGGTTTWRLRDSWPCGATMSTLTTVDIPALFNADVNTQAFVIDGVTEERFNSGVWEPFNGAGAPFELEPENQVAKINGPAGSCFNEGVYTLADLNKIPGAVFEGWSVRHDSNYPTSNLYISPSGNLTGHAAGVTVVATIVRPNGLREQITKYVGNLGVTFRIDKTADWCPISGTREVHVATTVANQPGNTYTYSMTFPPITSGYVFNYNSSAIVVSQITQAINYTASVTAQKTGSPGCTATNTMNTYALMLPCPSHFAAAAETKDDTSPTVFPNPAESSLSITPKSETPAQLRIISPKGNTIHAQTITNTTQIDVSMLPKGIYIIELRTERLPVDRQRVIIK